MERLDKHGDNWRNVPITFELEEMLGFHQSKPGHHTSQRSSYNNSAAGSGKVSLIHTNLFCSIHSLMQIICYTFSSTDIRVRGKVGPQT